MKLANKEKLAKWKMLLDADEKIVKINWKKKKAHVLDMRTNNITYWK